MTRAQCRAARNKKVRAESTKEARYVRQCARCRLKKHKQCKSVTCMCWTCVARATGGRVDDLVTVTEKDGGFSWRKNSSTPCVAAR